jgi:electron transfer flavoprotein alpha subunit
MANVLVFAESRGGSLRKVALEAVTAAREIAAKVGGEVHALVAGAPGIAAQAERLQAHGAQAVLVCEHEAFTQWNPEAIAALVASRAADYRVVVMSASAQGRDLAPRVAAKLRVPMVSDATRVTLDGDVVTAEHPGFTGKVVQTVELRATPAVVSLRPATVPPVEAAAPSRVEQVQPVGDPAASRVRVTETITGNSAKLDLGEAPVIVSGGRGMKAAENFALLEELAAAFGNAAVGATRAVSDDGWRPHADQIGQTGRLVSPELYIAVGISGAIQHLAGMRTSRTIVAINKDKEAPIFRVADYGIVGDALEIVPKLTEAVREARKA